MLLIVSAHDEITWKVMLVQSTDSEKGSSLEACQSQLSVGPLSKSGSAFTPEVAGTFLTCPQPLNFVVEVLSMIISLDL